MDDVLEELAALAILEHEEAHVHPVPYFIQLNNIFVIERLHNLNFIDERFQIFYIFLVDGFDRELLLRLPILSEVHDAEAASRQLLYKVILVLDLTLVRFLEQAADVNVDLISAAGRPRVYS